MTESPETYCLAVETSGRVGSVAIGRGDTILYESCFSGVMRHGAELLDALTALLNKVHIEPRQVGHLYITAGPGSFTGIRIAVTLAKMVSYAIGTQVVAVDTLDALAEGAAGWLEQQRPACRRIAPILDAKQNRFFTAIYERQGECWAKIQPGALRGPEELLALIQEDNSPVGLLGEGLVYYADKFTSPLTTLLEKSCWTASAAGVYAVGRRMAEQGQFSDVLSLVPAYMRKPDAVEKRRQKGKTA